MNVDIYLTSLLKIVENDVLEVVTAKEDKLLALYLCESINSIEKFLNN